MEKRANGILQLSAVCVGVRGQHREDVVLERYGGRCPLLLKGAGRVPDLRGLSPGLLGRSPRAAGPQESRGGPPREGRGRVLCPTPSQSARRARLRTCNPRPRVPAAAAASASAAAAGGGRRRQEGESGGKGTVTPEPKRAAPEPWKPAKGPASRGAMLEEGSSWPAPPPLAGGRDPRSKGLAPGSE